MTSAHFAASATSITFSFSRSAFLAEPDPFRSATATLETPESRKLSAWAWPWLKAKAEILGSVRRRRDWTPAEKAQFLEEALQPGATVASVADKHGISRGLFYQWMAKARAGLL